MNMESSAPNFGYYYYYDYYYDYYYCYYAIMLSLVYFP